MSVRETDLAKEKEARQQLEFYGFWLWNYTTNEFFQETDDEDTYYWDNLDRLLKCDLCPQRREYCVYCGLYIAEHRQRFVQSLFRPWFEDIRDVMSSKNKSLRYSASEIVNDSYRLLTGQIGSITSDKAYVLRELSSSTKILKIIKETTCNEWATIGLKNIIDVRIDTSLPLDVIIDDISKIYEASIDVWRYRSFNDEEIEDLSLDSKYDCARSYCRLLRRLKSFAGISFNANGHAARALGFWLWEQIDDRQIFPTVGQAVDFLDSGEYFPQDILQVFGYDESDMTVIGRLRRLTKRCVQEGEVMTMG